MRDAEAEQEKEVEVGDPPQPAPVEQTEEEDRAKGQEHVGRVELVAERSRVAARHLPGDLVPRPRLAHLAVGGVDDDEGNLLVAGEPGDLPAAVDTADAVRQLPVLLALLGDVRVAGGDLDRPRGVHVGTRAGREDGGEEEEGQEQPARGPCPGARRYWSHLKPKWS